MSTEFAGRNPFVVPRPLVYRGGVNVETLADDMTLTLRSATFQVLGGGTADRTVTLPTVSAADTNGLLFEVNNSGATDDLIISDGSTVATLTPGAWARLLSDGTDWYVMDSSSASTTSLADSAQLIFGDGSDIAFAWDGTRLNVTQATPNSELRWGVDGAGIDQMWYGDTASTYMTWDQSADSLILSDAASIVFGTGSDISAVFDGTNLVIATAVADTGAVEFGADDAGVDVVLYGDTASAACTWDQSTDSLILSGVAKLKTQTIADPGDGAAIPVTHSGSLAITTAAAETNTLADPTFMGQWLTIFVDTYAVGDRVITAASRINQAANTIITLGAVGDAIKLEAITIGGALKWQVVANDGAALS